MCCQNQVNPSSPCFLRNSCDELFHFFANDHHHVGKFVNDDDYRGQGCELGRWHLFLGPQRVSERLPPTCGLFHLPIKPCHIPDTQCRHQSIAPFHFCNTPIKCMRGFFHICHDRSEKMGNTIIDRQFQHLRVNQYEAHFFRCGFAQNA